MKKKGNNISMFGIAILANNKWDSLQIMDNFIQNLKQQSDNLVKIISLNID